MNLELQIFSFIICFLYGNFHFLTFNLFRRYLNNKKNFIYLFYNFIFFVFHIFLFFLILILINNGILHIYFFLFYIFGVIFMMFCLRKFT